MCVESGTRGAAFAAPSIGSVTSAAKPISLRLYSLVRTERVYHWQFEEDLCHAKPVDRRTPRLDRPRGCPDLRRSQPPRYRQIFNRDRAGAAEVSERRRSAADVHLQLVRRVAAAR